MDNGWSGSVLARYPREREIEYQLCLRRLNLRDDDARRWKIWVKKQWRPKKHDINKTHSVGAVDISGNRLRCAGLLHILEAVECLGGGMRILKAQANELEDFPIDALLTRKVRLMELHLSHNNLPQNVLQSLVETVVECGRYPVDGRAIWMRIEKNPGSASGVLEGKAAFCLDRICLVDGQRGCTPYACCRGGRTPPAIHLPYVNIAGPAIAPQNEVRKHPSASPPKKSSVKNLNAWTQEAASLRLQRAQQAAAPSSSAEPQGGMESSRDCHRRRESPLWCVVTEDYVAEDAECLSVSRMDAVQLLHSEEASEAQSVRSSNAYFYVKHANRQRGLVPCSVCSPPLKASPPHRGRA